MKHKRRPTNRPGAETAATGEGSTGQLRGGLLANVADVKMLHVPCKGGSPPMMDLLAGRVDISFSNAVSVMPHIRNGRIRTLAVVADARLPELPNGPTMKGLGFQHFDIDPWYGLMAPANTPAPIVQKLKSSAMKITQMPAVREVMAKQGLAIVPPNTPEEFSARFTSDVRMYAEIVKNAGINPQ